jgi:hypothetical protein
LLKGSVPKSFGTLVFFVNAETTRTASSILISFNSLEENRVGSLHPEYTHMQCARAAKGWTRRSIKVRIIWILVNAFSGSGAQLGDPLHQGLGGCHLLIDQSMSPG